MLTVYYFAIAIILTGAVTFLITDFRRHLEILDIEDAYNASLDQIVESAFDRGYEMGALLENGVTLQYDSNDPYP